MIKHSEPCSVATTATTATTPAGRSITKLNKRIDSLLDALLISVAYDNSTMVRDKVLKMLRSLKRVKG